MRQKKAEKLLKQIKATYEKIAEDFHRTRKAPGKEFDLFKPYIKTGAHIIDLGCGNGRLLPFLYDISKDWPKPPFRYIGIDNNSHMLAIARKHYPLEVFIPGDLLHIPVEDRTADLIFHIRTFHHVPSKRLRLQALSEMRRILKYNGILIITVWNLWQKKYWKYLGLGMLRFLYSLGGYAPNDTFIPWGKKAKRYYHAFTPTELYDLVNNSGFEIEEFYCVKDGKRVPFKQSHDMVIIAKKIMSPDED